MSFAEALRLDAKYDRVMLGWGVVACQGSSCEMVQDRGGVRRVVPVPDELQASTVSKRCIGGRGIVCADPMSRDLKWAVAPGLLAAPVSVFTQLGDDDFLVIDSNGTASLVRGGVVTPFDFGTNERIVQVSAGYYMNPQEWGARTESGRLVRGSLAGGRACDLHVADIDIGEITPIVMRDADRVMMGQMGSARCYAYGLPSGMLGVAYNTCGISLTVFAFDSRRVYAPPAGCALD
ncbi:hypothetical protein AKJ09_00292 [Labilithrix luteola]|uniref:Uncharacterized protein n=1 Tax=Labilithrix luteola TaxID=1391654 RepID=A0A0K1PJA7_9BACT|nr:hypothetical protein [Labilithrix luteola]AKU93628.1 hypothetical protein AKJ09_00292 [Labilithrix luteola]